MKPISRRTAVGTIIGCGFVAASSAMGSGAFAQTRITVPAAPMILSRRLERPLRGDDLIVVEREWRIVFSEQGRGYIISGEQISSRVAAPSVLAPLAKVEEARSTDSMWPILLNARGTVAAAGGAASQSDLEAAKRAALEIISQRGISGAEESLHAGYLEIVAEAGSSLLERLPEDLFFPTGRESRMTETVELPGGVSGEFSVAYSAAATSHGWLDRAVREVTTRVGETRSSAREQWALRVG